MMAMPAEVIVGELNLSSQHTNMNSACMFAHMQAHSHHFFQHLSAVPIGRYWAVCLPALA